jgi:hypothetical protein
MSSPTAVSLPPLTTESGSRGRRSQYTSDKPPPAKRVSYDPAMVGTRYGWVTIASSERRHPAPRSAGAHVLTVCNGCGYEGWIWLQNLQWGRSKGCQPCSQPINPRVRIRGKMKGAMIRCTDPTKPEWESYGGRGIEFRFESLEASVDWVMENLGQPGDLSIDRIDNDGHYEPGNIRWATQSQQTSNQRRTRLKEFHQEHWPYSECTVRRKLREGKTRSEIIAEAEMAVAEKRKAWRTIEARLGSMTSSIPDHVIGSRWTGF